MEWVWIFFWNFGTQNHAGVVNICGLRGQLHLARLKINFAITWKNLSTASWVPSIAMPGSRLSGLKIYHVIVIAGPTLSRH